MTRDISEAEARLALRSIEDNQRQVIDQIDLPQWYWWGLASAWVALGVVSDVADPWIGAVATFLFGTVNAAAAQWVLPGRHGSRHLSVRAGVVDRHLPVILFVCLVALALVTIVAGFAAHADGARHPSTIAAVVVAVAILGGGPRVLEAARRRAALGLAA